MGIYRTSADPIDLGRSSFSFNLLILYRTHDPVARHNLFNFTCRFKLICVYAAFPSGIMTGLSSVKCRWAGLICAG